MQREEFVELKRLEDQAEFWRRKTQSGSTRGDRHAAKVKLDAAQSAVDKFIYKTIKAPTGDHAAALHFLEARAEHWRVLSRPGKGGASTKGKRNKAKAKLKEAESDRRRFLYDPGFLARHSESAQAVRVSQVIRFGVEGKTEGFTYDTVQGLAAFYKRFENAPAEPTTLRERGASVVNEVRKQFLSDRNPIKVLQEKVRKWNKESDLPAGHDVAAQFETAPGLAGRAKGATRSFDDEVVQPLYDLAPRVAGIRNKAGEGNALHDFNVYLGLRRAKDRLEFGQRIRDEIKEVQGEIARRKGITDIAKSLPEEKAALKGLKDKLTNLKERSQKEVGDYTVKDMDDQLAAFRSKMNNQGAGRFETMVESGEAFQRHTDRALRLQVESGRISESMYQRIKKDNGFYAPFSLQKYNEAIGEGMGAHAGTGFDSQKQLTKAIVGINDHSFKLNEITEAGRKIIYTSEMTAGQNEIMQKFGKMADADVDGLFVKRLDPKRTIESQLKPGQESVTVMVGGEPVHYAVSAEVADSIRFNYSGSPIETALRASSTPFKLGATGLSYKFQFKNLLTDAHRAAFISEMGIKNPTDAMIFTKQYARALLSAIRGQEFTVPLTGRKTRPDAWYKDAEKASVLRGGLWQMAQPEHVQAYAPLGKRANLIDSATKFGNAIEESWKILGVQRALKMTGAKDVKTLYKNNPWLIPEIRRYMGSPDFSRFGRSMQKMNLLFMFSNARIQGTASDLARADVRDKRGQAAWVKMGLFVGGPAAANWAYNYIYHREDMKNVPQRDQENNHIVFKGNSVTNDQGVVSTDYWMIPLKETPKMVANGVKATLDFAASKDPEAVKKWSMQMLENISPVNIEGDNASERIESVASSLHPAFRMGVEAFLSGEEGRSWWQHRDLMSPTMAAASPRLQYRESTEKAYVHLAHLIGDKGPKWLPDQLRSPIMLEHIVSTWTASMIKQFIPKGELQGRSRLMNHPVVRTLARGFVSSGYVENSEDRKYIKELRTLAANDTILGMKESKRFLDARQGKKVGLLLEEARVAYPIWEDTNGDGVIDKNDEANLANAKMLERIADRVTERHRKITLQEKVVKQLPPAQRALFIAKKLKGLSPSHQQDYMNLYLSKGLISERTYMHMMQNAAREVEKMEGEFELLPEHKMGGEFELLPEHKMGGEFELLPEKK